MAWPVGNGSFSREGSDFMAQQQMCPTRGSGLPPLVLYPGMPPACGLLRHSANSTPFPGTVSMYGHFKLLAHLILAAVL